MPELCSIHSVESVVDYAAASPATGVSIASSSPAYASQAHSQATPVAHFNANITGASVPGQAGDATPKEHATGSNSAAAPATPVEFPAITPYLATKYGETYKQATKDGNGSIAGPEVLRLLAPVPVDVSVKKAAWDVVAGQLPIQMPDPTRHALTRFDTASHVCNRLKLGLCNAGSKGSLTVHEFFTILYLLDVYAVQRTVPDALPSGIFPPGVHQCYLAAGVPAPLSLQPPTVAHVPLAEQNPVENLALEAESATPVRLQELSLYLTWQFRRQMSDLSHSCPASHPPTDPGTQLLSACACYVVYLILNQ